MRCRCACGGGGSAFIASLTAGHADGVLPHRLLCKLWSLAHTSSPLVALCSAEVLKRQRDAAAQKKAKAERRKAKAEAEVGRAAGFGRRRLSGHIKLSLHRRVGPPPLNWRPNHAMPHPNCPAQSQLGRDVTGERPPVCPHPQAAAASAPAKPKAAPSGPIAFLFPGQGSQAVGMLKVGWAEWRGLMTMVLQRPA